VSSVAQSIAGDGLCGRCSRRRASFQLQGASRCLLCTLRHRPLLKRSFLTALVVGTILTAINQGNILLQGEFPSSLAWKVPLTYSVPFCVATWGALINSRIASPPAAVADRVDTDRIGLDVADEAGLAPTDSRLS
jgi:hypothetical protein